MGKIVVALLVLFGLGGGGWFALGQWGGAEGTNGAPRLARAAGGGSQIVASAPQGPQSQPPNASRWQMDAAAEITAFQWGGRGQEEIFDMVARQNGNMIISGMLPTRDGIPAAARQRHHLLDDRGSQNFGFLAEISADGTELLWISTFGGDLIRPEVLALSPDGTIAVGGRVLDRAKSYPGLRDEVPWDSGSASSVVGLIAADGSEVLWMKEGGPNQETIRGLAIDQDGRVYFTAGGRERGARAYVIRLNADGSHATFAKSSIEHDDFWAINFDVRTPEFKVPGQIGEFYAKGVGQAYAYDGPNGWGAVRWWLYGIREGGNIVFLPDGDFVVTGSLQYDFVKGRDRRFPAFDLIMARYTQDGELVWSTNLYQEGDSVHTPDQIDQHLIYNPANGDLYVAAIQHGSNLYRFKGELIGDTGNLMIGWIGQVDPEDGTLKNGWYWQSNRNGQYTRGGSPQSPPHPKLSGNRPVRLTSDSEGRIYMTGPGSARMFTTPNAWKPWPDSQVGGTSPGLVILSPNLNRYEYATTLRGDDERTGTTNADARAVIVNEHGVWVAGENGTRNFPTGPQPAWANPGPVGERDKFLLNLRF
ncbi:MAG: hypothetical protein JJU29_21440 [Verrucomicrobia bacterium]|nr:hypothetical protein [Verrucomicrobiota bacterium]MCH8511613.1 hypothetical protein [Kiritimatiellia bacterium]